MAPVPLNWSVEETVVNGRDHIGVVLEKGNCVFGYMDFFKGFNSVTGDGDGSVFNVKL